MDSRPAPTRFCRPRTPVGRCFMGCAMARTALIVACGRRRHHHLSQPACRARRALRGGAVADTVLRWFALAHQCAMLAATPIDGSHYLVDMLAGAADRRSPAGGAALQPYRATCRRLQAAAAVAFSPTAPLKLLSERAARIGRDQGSASMKLSAEQLKAFDEQGYVFFPNCFSEDEIALLRIEGEQHPQARPPGSLAREIRRAAHRFRRAQIQRGVPSCWRAIRGWSSR